jgi:hypothetical protein
MRGKSIGMMRRENMIGPIFWPFLCFGAILNGGEGARISAVSEVRRLAPERAAEGLPVRLRGVVTWHPEGAFYGLIVDDGKEGIYCDVSGAVQRGLLPARYESEVLPQTVNEGVLVEIEGVTSAGAFAPMVFPTRVAVLGKGEMPTPVEKPFLNLFSGMLDCQRVVVEGVVRSASREAGKDAVTLNVGTFYGLFQFQVLEASELVEADLVDAKVRVTGCVLPIYNGRMEMVGVTVQSNRLEDLVILEAAPKDRFAVPEITAAALRPFSAEGVELRRQKVRGVVTAVRPGACVMVQRGEHGVQAFSPMTESVEVGDLVEAVGFVNFRAPVGCLENTLFRKVGTGALPLPKAVTVEKLMASGGDAVRDPLREDWDCKLVSLKGVLSNIDQRQTEVKVTIKSDGRFMPAVLAKTAGGEVFADLKVGAVVCATGVVSLTYKAVLPMGNELKPSGLLLVMRTEADMEVLQAAPWWTEDRVQLAQGLVPLLGLAAGLWIVALRRTVSMQGRRLQEALLAFRDVDREKEVCREERQRLAGDLHDGFQQALAGAMYQVDSALTCADELPEVLKKRLGGADAALKEAQKGLREVLWGLTEEGEGANGFGDLLRHVVSKRDHWQDLVTVRDVGRCGRCHLRW